MGVPCVCVPVSQLLSKLVSWQGGMLQIGVAMPVEPVGARTLRVMYPPLVRVRCPKSFGCGFKLYTKFIGSKALSFVGFPSKAGKLLDSFLRGLF